MSLSLFPETPFLPLARAFRCPPLQPSSSPVSLCGLALFSSSLMNFPSGAREIVHCLRGCLYIACSNSSVFSFPLLCTSLIRFVVSFYSPVSCRGRRSGPSPSPPLTLHPFPAPFRPEFLLFDFPGGSLPIYELARHLAWAMNSTFSFSMLFLEVFGTLLDPNSPGVSLLSPQASYKCSPDSRNFR